jgi:hypothetical protein
MMEKLADSYRSISWYAYKRHFWRLQIIFLDNIQLCSSLQGIYCSDGASKCESRYASTNQLAPTTQGIEFYSHTTSASRARQVGTRSMGPFWIRSASSLLKLEIWSSIMGIKAGTRLRLKSTPICLRRCACSLGSLEWQSQTEIDNKIHFDTHVIENSAGCPSWTNWP